MGKEKQIEDMARITKAHCELDNQCGSCHWETCNDCFAEILYNAGYRRQSEGEWISNELGGYKYAFYCNECGWVDGYPFNDRHKYCPNCGAKMKGGE